jgi:hypothetical protein
MDMSAAESEIKEGTWLAVSMSLQLKSCRCEHIEKVTA